MTTSDPKKVYKQLIRKPAKLAKFNKHNLPKKKLGRSNRKCERCGRVGGHIRKYNINLCRQCFREMAKRLGFRKFS